MRSILHASIASLLIAAALAHPAIAEGDPKIVSGGELPADLTADVYEGLLHSGGVEVRARDLAPALSPACSRDQALFKSVTYDRKAHALVVESGCGAGTVTVPRAHVRARLARAQAWRAELRGDLATARRQYQASLALEADERVARDLARVALGQGDRAAALAVMKPFATRAPVAHYAAALASARFEALLDEPVLSGLRTTTPGTAQIGGVASRIVARSDQHDLLAIVHERKVDPHRIELVIVDASGAVVTMMPIVSPDDSSVVRSDELAAARLAACNRLLRELGFDAVTDAELARLAPKPKDDHTAIATFAKARLGVAVKDGAARLLSNNRVLAEAAMFACTDPKVPGCELAHDFAEVALLPSLHLLLVVREIEPGPAVAVSRIPIP